MNIESIYNIGTNRDKYLEFWNHPAVTAGNCYSYALQFPWSYLNLGYFPNPGFSRLTNMDFKKKTVTLDDFVTGCQADGLTLLPPPTTRHDFPDVPPEHYLVVATFTLDTKNLFRQRVKHYHFIRHHNGTNIFSDRNGCNGKVEVYETTEDAIPFPKKISGQPVMGALFFAAPNNGLDISIARMLSNLKDNASQDPLFIKHAKIIKAWQDFQKDVSKFSVSNHENLGCLWDSYKNIFIAIKEHGKDGFQDDLIKLIKSHRLSR